MQYIFLPTGGIKLQKENLKTTDIQVKSIWYDDSLFFYKIHDNLNHLYFVAFQKWNFQLIWQKKSTYSMADLLEMNSTNLISFISIGDQMTRKDLSIQSRESSKLRCSHKFQLNRVHLLANLKNILYDVLFLFYFNEVSYGDAHGLH